MLLRATERGHEADRLEVRARAIQGKVNTFQPRSNVQRPAPTGPVPYTRKWQELVEAGAMNSTLDPAKSEQQYLAALREAERIGLEDQRLATTLIGLGV